MITKEKNYWTWVGLRCLEFLGRLRSAIIFPENWVKTNKAIEIGGFTLACMLIVSLAYAFVAVFYIWIVYFTLPSVQITLLFLFITGAYLFASNRIRVLQGLFIRSNLAVINILGAFFFATCFIMQLNNYFTPIYQTIFKWPGLIVFVILAIYGWLDFKEYVFLRSIKAPGDWKDKTRDKRLSDQEIMENNLIYHILPKIGLTFILLGTMARILSGTLESQYKIINFSLIGRDLAIIGLIFWLSAVWFWGKISKKRSQKIN